MLKRMAQAGTLESSDCLVVAAPGHGLTVEYRGQNKAIFGRRAETVAAEVAERLSPDGARLTIQDQGALEVTLRARLETALRRAMEDGR